MQRNNAVLDIFFTLMLCCVTALLIIVVTVVVITVLNLLTITVCNTGVVADNNELKHKDLTLHCAIYCAVYYAVYCALCYITHWYLGLTKYDTVFGSAKLPLDT